MKILAKLFKYLRGNNSPKKNIIPLIHPQIILLNAPPKSGKDTLTDYVESEYDIKRLEMKGKMKDLLILLYDLTPEQYNLCSQPKNKETEYEFLDGRSYRTAMIHISENVIKPNFGEDYFVNSVIRQIDPAKVNLITDLGFPIELKKFEDKYPESLLVKIHRNGSDYSNDSRVDLNSNILRTIDIDNNGELIDLYIQGEKLMNNQL